MQSKQCIVVALIAGLGVAMAARAESVGERLHKGIYQEETVGNLEAAMQIYQQIVADERANRAHVAQAKYRLGMCHLKKGQKNEAVETLGELIEEFPGQTTLIGQARGQLVTLGHAPESDGSAQVQARLVWSYPGLSQVMSVSPDGRYLAYCDHDTGDLALRDLTTGNNRRLTTSGADQKSSTTEALFSPNGEWLAYNWRSSPGARTDLRVVRLDGSESRIVFGDEKIKHVVPRGWSPDGMHILARLSLSAEDVTQIAFVSIADGSLRVVRSFNWQRSDDHRMILSPDGRYIVYDFHANGDSGQEDIALFPVDGGPEVRVIEHPADDDAMGWAPDGRSLLFRSDRRGEGDDAWVIQIIDGKPQGVPQRVKKGIHMGGWVAGNGRFTDDGSYYYPVSRPSQVFHHVYLATLDPDSGKLAADPEPLEGRPPQRSISPDFSHDGKYLAYYVAAPGERTPQGWRWGPGNIVVRTLETGQERVITLSPRFSDGGWWPFLRWNPDGRSILVGGRTAKRAGVFQVDVATGKVSPLVVGPSPIPDYGWQLTNNADPEEGEHVWPGEWSADGKSIFYSRYHFTPNAPEEERATDWRIFKRNLKTGKEEEIRRSPEGQLGFRNFMLSPDGQRLFLASGKALWTCPITGGEPHKLLKLESWRELFDQERIGFSSRVRWRTAWTPDGRHLLFLKGGRWAPELWRIAAEGGKPELLDTLPASRNPGIRPLYSTQELRVHPGGRQIAFVRLRRSQDLWVLKNFLPDLAAPLVQLPNPPEGSYLVTRSADDAEERPNGVTVLDSDDLDFGQISAVGETVSYAGVRFEDIQIPKRARIKKAFLRFSKEGSDMDAEPSELTIHAELSGNAHTFAASKHNISSRKRTEALVKWSPEPWHLSGERSKKQQTPDLSALIQEVVAQADWLEGNALVLIISGSGERDAMSFDGGGQRYAPMLHLEF